MDLINFSNAEKSIVVFTTSLIDISFLVSGHTKFIEITSRVNAVGAVLMIASCSSGQSGLFFTEFNKHANISVRFTFIDFGALGPEILNELKIAALCGHT